MLSPILSSSRDYLLNIANPYLEQMVLKTEFTQIRLNKANYLDAESPFLNLDLSITNGIVSFIMISILKSFDFHFTDLPLHSMVNTLTVYKFPTIKFGT